MDKWQKAAFPINVYYSYATQDEELRCRLEKHLSLLRRQNLISEWHSHKILAGSDRAQTIDRHLDTASLILLLISSDFIASDYCYGIEMQRALERHRAGLTRVIPVLLRPVDWQDAPFASLQCLPRDGRSVVQWSDPDEAFVSIVEGIREVLADVQGEEGTISEPLRPVGDQNRQRFIKRVRTTWIEGVLERSLYNDTLMTLGLHEMPEAVTNPWRLLAQETDQPPRLLPIGTSIVQIYNDADGELLILGEPGAGKTTLLLQLARHLLSLAEQNAHFPLPAVFNLSTWAEKRQSLASWLVEELHDRYQVPHRLGETWIASAQLLPLLDGLDEMAASHRSACIAAINAYRHEHSLSPFVLCSRHAEYMDQSARVALQRSIVVQPLTAQQIDEYLSNVGDQLAEVRITLRDDEELRDLVTTPLMLTILILAYKGISLDELAAIKSPALQRRQIFERYVVRMFQRRGAATQYTFEQTVVWLAALAKQMKRHNWTVFYIERIKRGWLDNQGNHLFYSISTILICVLMGVLAGAFVITQIGGMTTGLLGVLAGLLSFGVIGGVVSVLNLEARPSDTFIWSWKVIRREWFILLILTFSGGLAGGLDFKPGRALLSVIFGMIFGCLVGVLLGVLHNGLDVVLDVPHIITPNQEIRRSGYHSLLMLSIGIFFTLLFISFGRLEIILAAMFAVVGTLEFGGLACIQHYIIRFLLWRSGQLPWNLPRFLDYATERILLRKVGGGYIFIHRLLLDYFASLDKIPNIDERKK